MYWYIYIHLSFCMYFIACVSICVHVRDRVRASVSDLSRSFCLVKKNLSTKYSFIHCVITD